VRTRARRFDSTVWLGTAVLMAALLLTLDGAGTLELGWGWALSLVCACAGLGLIVAAPVSRTLYAGALARFTPNPRTLWGLRAATVITAPVAALGPVLYALLALAQALTEPDHREPELDWRRALGTGLLGLSFVLCATELGAALGDDALLWPALGGATALSAFWWLSGPSPAVRRTLGAIVVFLLLFYGAFAVSSPDAIFLAGVAGAMAITLIVAPRRAPWRRARTKARAARSRAPGANRAPARGGPAR
jgi:hypothetical protein